MSKSIISIRDLSYAYETAEGALTVALNGVDLEIGEGSFVAILGHNGSGKSTLAKHMNSVLLPMGGKVWVDGMDSSDERLFLAIRRTVGMVFQNPDNQIVSNVVEEDVAFAPENLGIEPGEIRRRVDEALKAVDMYEHRESAPHLLSGGQKQRIAIAGVIAMLPRCIVLDEPTAMLDPAGRAEVISTVLRLNREKGITVVLITHNMNETIDADRLLVMSDGRIIKDGSPCEIFSQVEMLTDLGLTVPDSTQLIYALRKKGCSLPLDALTTEACAQAIARIFKDQGTKP